jgi:tRNA pseudouridine38-40 synthase
LPRLAFQTQFVGAKFCGSQKQSNARSVQEELEKAFSIFFKEKIIVTLSSRVDSGVHARGMIGHCDVSELPQLSEHELCRHLNGILPNDVAVLKLKEVPSSFHSRRDAIERSYVYKLRAYSQKHPLDESQVVHIASSLKLESLQKMASSLIGEHDFTGLSKPADYKTRPICKINECFWTQNFEDGLFMFKISADHFLYNMVRIIIGTQIAIENGKLSSDCLEKALRLKDRSYAGFTAPAEGLCLEAVKYPYNLFSS